MKKSIFTLLLALTICSCSNDEESSSSNCQSNIDTINEKYDKQIQYVKDNPGTTGIDYRQIGLLNQERNLKIDSACN